LLPSLLSAKWTADSTSRRSRIFWKLEDLGDLTWTPFGKSEAKFSGSILHTADSASFGEKASLTAPAESISNSCKLSCACTEMRASSLRPEDCRRAFPSKEFTTMLPPHVLRSARPGVQDSVPILMSRSPASSYSLCQTIHTSCDMALFPNLKILLDHQLKDHAFHLSRGQLCL